MGRIPLNWEASSLTDLGERKELLSLEEVWIDWGDGPIRAVEAYLIKNHDRGGGENFDKIVRAERKCSP